MLDSGVGFMIQRYAVPIGQRNIIFVAWGMRGYFHAQYDLTPAVKRKNNDGAIF